MKICNQCGKEVPDRAKFCPNCGMTFDLPNPEPEAQPANPPVPEAGVTTVLYRPDLQTPPEAAQTPPPAQNPEPVQNPYAGQRQPSYGNPNPYAGQNQPAYGNPNPYAAQNQAPYGSPNPYAGQNQAPYGGQNPYGGQQPIYANPGWQQPAPSSPLTRTGNPVMEAIRRCGASGLTLLAALLVTAPLLYSIIYASCFKSVRFLPYLIVTPLSDPLFAHR